MLGASKHLREKCSGEITVPLNSSSISENELHVYKITGEKSVFPEIQNNMKSVIPQPLNVRNKNCLTLRKPSKFSAHFDVFSGVQMTPIVKKIKLQQILKDDSSCVLSETLMNFNVSHLFSATPECASASNCITFKHSVVIPEVKTVVPHHLLSGGKKKKFSITSVNSNGYEDMCSKSSNTVNSTADCSFHGDVPGTSKIKTHHLLSDKKKSLSDALMNYKPSQNEYLEIESTDSLVKNASFSCNATLAIHKEEEANISDDSDYSNDLVQHNLFPVRNISNEICTERNNSRREKPSYINVCAKKLKPDSLQKTCCTQQEVIPAHKGSDWVKSIKLLQELVPKYETEHGGYSEKKKKYLVGGFAEQAQKLENSMKSEVVLWYYQRSTAAEIGLRKYLTLKIQSYSVVDTIIIAKCEVLSDSSTCDKLNADELRSLFNLTFPRTNETQNGLKKEYFFKNCSMKESIYNLKDSVCGNALQRKAEKIQHCLVGIKLGTWKKLKLAIDNIINIFPPWQTLWVNCTSVHILLCTYFIEVQRTSCAAEKLLSEKVLYSRAA